MEQGKAAHHQLFQESWDQYENLVKNKDHSAKCTSSTSSAEDSMISISSLSDEEVDSSSSSSLSSSSRALYDLSEIMEQLPIKRGLSKFYQGKSDSFTSLASVRGIQDLAKRTTQSRRKVKGTSSGLNSYKNYTLPKPTISKKSTSKRGGFMTLTPLQKNLQC